MPDTRSKSIHIENFKVHSYEVNSKQEATLETLSRYFQEAAWNHAEALGVGYKRLVQDHKLWVLSRLAVRVDRYPRWGETIQVVTWPRAAKSVFAMRDFEFADSDQNRLVAGTSAWLVLDVVTRKPQRIDKLVAKLQPLSERRALPQDPEKIPAPAAVLNTMAPVRMTARYGDIDVNGHVNNSRYIGWLLDAYPSDFHQHHSIAFLEINYLGETLSAEPVTIQSDETSSGEFVHTLGKANSQEPICRARIKWKGNKE